MIDDQSSKTEDQHASMIVLACDESGAKGYADVEEAFPGEVGVFVGVLVAVETLPVVTSEFDALVRAYAPADGKLHIADLSPGQQSELRSDVFGLVTRHALPCLYEAIHVRGFSQTYTHLKDAVEGARNKRRSATKMSGRAGPPAPSLHTTLFEGLYSKALAFCMEKGHTAVHIEVRTDQIDAPIVRDFRTVAEELLSTKAVIRRVTGFDPGTKSVVEGEIRVGARSTEGLLPIEVTHLELNVVDDSDGLVLAADVIANSLTHLFHNRPDGERFMALNTPQAFASHRLKGCLDVFKSWGEYSLSDTFYRHPNDPALSE